ncbi:MAG: PASTA domain-containing protein [Thermoleophilaceae bacterium]
MASARGGREEAALAARSCSGCSWLALIGVMAYAFTRPEETSVPKVVGLQLGKARARLDRDGFEKVKVERERSRAELDTVLRQDPDPGESARQGPGGHPDRLQRAGQGAGALGARRRRAGWPSASCRSRAWRSRPTPRPRGA